MAVLLRYVIFSAGKTNLPSQDLSVTSRIPCSKPCIYFHLFVIDVEVGSPHSSLLLSAQYRTRLTGVVICLLLLFFVSFSSIHKRAVFQLLSIFVC